MIVAAGFFVAGVGCSLALIIRELRKAPEGYEDERLPHCPQGCGETRCSRLDEALRTRSSLNWALHRTRALKLFE
jgi:hypothetical protein